MNPYKQAKEEAQYALQVLTNRDHDKETHLKAAAILSYYAKTYDLQIALPQDVLPNKIVIAIKAIESCKYMLSTLQLGKFNSLVSFYNERRFLSPKQQSFLIGLYIAVLHIDLE